MRIFEFDSFGGTTGEKSILGGDVCEVMRRMQPTNYTDTNVVGLKVARSGNELRRRQQDLYY